MALVVLVAAHLPEVGVHRLLAVGEVLLCEEVNLVLGDLRQVFLTRRYHRSYRLEALADSHLFRFERRGTNRFLPQIDSVTMRAGCRCLAVRTQQHLLVVVLTTFLHFVECSGNIINSVAPYYFCHSLLAMTRTTARSALV